jgi:hypothetical protein
MVAFGGEGEGGFRVVGCGVEVGAVGEEELEDFEMAIGGRGEERRVPGAVAVIGVAAVFEEPLDDLGVAAGDGAG